MTDTPNLMLPFLAASQAQKHVTHNDALLMLDAIVQLEVLDKDLATPPQAPADGERYIVAPDATGAWAGQVGHVAAWQDGAWRFYAPQIGWRAFVRDEGKLYVKKAEGWGDLSENAAPDLQNVPLFGLGTQADAGSPFAAKLNDALWTAAPADSGGTGDLRLKLNKEGTGNNLSLLFQSGYAGRAEAGLLGGDDFTMKVSADGSTWIEAFKIFAGSGQIGLLPGGLLGGGRLRSFSFLSSSGTWTRPAGVRFALVFALGAGGGGGGAAGAASAGACGGGGGAGGFAVKLLDVTSIESVAVTIGTGGAGGATSGGNGAAGGDTSFGSHVQARGGTGGSGQAAANFVQAVPGGLGGGADNGDFNFQGGAGSPGIRFDGQNGVSGNGGASFLGGGARGQIGNANGGMGVARGDGGSGAAVANSATGRAGGPGADGLVWVWEFE